MFPASFIAKRELRRNARVIVAIVFTIAAMIILEILAHSGLVTSKAGQPATEVQLAAHKHQHNLTDILAPRQCGSSPTEAQSHGCVFDLLSFAWQAPECYDSDTIAEFEAATHWTYYADEAGTVPVPQDEVALGLRSVHVRWEFHLVHCMFMRRQMLRAVLDGRHLDGHVAAYGHTVHCGTALLDEDTPLGNLGTTTPVILPACKPIEVWRRELGGVMR
jgi:hypothetical protein